MIAFLIPKFLQDHLLAMIRQGRQANHYFQRFWISQEFLYFKFFSISDCIIFIEKYIFLYEKILDFSFFIFYKNIFQFVVLKSFFLKNTLPIIKYLPPLIKKFSLFRKQLFFVKLF